MKKNFVTNLNSRGLTLIELLLGIVISSIVIVIFISIFLSGINNYTAIKNESQLRSEADYILASILNSMYDYSPDSVTIEENQIKLNKYQEINFNEEDGILERTIKTNDAKVIKLEDYSVYIDDGKTNSSNINIITNGSDRSYFSVTCFKGTEDDCTHGIVQINLTIHYKNEEDNKRIDPMKLSSSFGF